MPLMDGSRTFFGHPSALATLFFTEMWERFTFYGMRALLVLFLVDAVANGGYGLDDKTATAIYGLYTASVFMAALPGGWIADRLIGAQRAVIAGGVFMTVGNLMLATPGPPELFFSGLVVIVLGVGLLKPSISTLVADLYPEGGGRRDAGFTIFYMGINTGAFIGPVDRGLARAQASAGASGFSPRRSACRLDCCSSGWRGSGWASPARRRIATMGARACEATGSSSRWPWPCSRR